MDIGFQIACKSGLPHLYLIRSNKATTLDMTESLLLCSDFRL